MRGCEGRVGYQPRSESDILTTKPKKGDYKVNRGQRESRSELVREANPTR